MCCKCQLRQINWQKINLICNEYISLWKTAENMMYINKLLSVQHNRLVTKFIILLIFMFYLIWVGYIYITITNQWAIHKTTRTDIVNKTIQAIILNNTIHANIVNETIHANIVKKIKMHKNIQCYVLHDKYSGESEIFKIDDILSNERKPNKGNSIFFHETSCSSTGQIKLTAREACAIESAALLNPNLDIFVLFASPITNINKNQTQFDVNIQEALKLYKNIYFRNVNLWSYANKTPINAWFKSGKLFYSNSIQSHVADLLRYITLWRWGGTHLDLDIVLIKTLENIKPNFVGIEDEYTIANGVLNLDYAGFGHNVADMILRQCQTDYNPYGYTSIGPVLLTKVVSKICKTNLVKLMTIARCSGLKVYDSNVFYAIEWTDARYFFHEKYLDKILNKTKESIAIHVWNKLTTNIMVKVGSNVAYAFYAKKYCPKVYRSCGVFF